MRKGKVAKDNCCEQGNFTNNVPIDPAFQFLFAWFLIPQE